MIGGLVSLGKGVVYSWMILPINQHIFRYDQFVHIFGFCMATLVVWELLKPIVRGNHWVRVGIVVIMAGLGIGALNEIIEIAAVLLVPETGVGGYINTFLDLVADIISAIIVYLVVYFRKN